MTEPTDTTTRTAVITGASSGIGAAFARQLAREGYALILHGRREHLLSNLCTELRETCGVRAEYMLAELSDEDDLRRLESKIRETPTLDMLINNAGYSTLRHFDQEDVEGQERMIRVHVIATMRLAHAAIPVMHRRGGGSIINVSSVAGFMFSAGSVTYCATKAYLITFTEALHLELRGTGIRVQALCPGWTRTDFHARLGVNTSAYARLFMSPGAVVNASLKGLKRGQVVCIPGIVYKVSALAFRLLPKPILYRVVAAASSRNPVKKSVKRDSA
jgi:hypothetical protein